MNTKIIKAIQNAHEEYQSLKGGAGSGNFGHTGVPGHVGGSAPGGGHGSASGGETSIPAGGRSTPHPKGLSIKFDEVPGYHRLASDTNEAFDKALAKVEAAIGRKLYRDVTRQDFPGFTYYEDGEELGSGGD